MKIYVVKILDISESELNKLTRYIDAEKKYKINKFINKKDKIRSLISEILIRNIIFENLKINNRDIIFE
ncbi:MAG TPA: 4-phosphopantetheinyl transferase, partial [Clostridium sp.]|nr:4-phosphopantetheinyl transferase [Clostridium sp.]